MGIDTRFIFYKNKRQNLNSDYVMGADTLLQATNKDYFADSCITFGFRCIIVPF